MTALAMSPDEKYEGFDIYVIREASRAVKHVQELSKKKELSKAVQKYLKEEKEETEGAIKLTDNL